MVDPKKWTTKTNEAIAAAMQLATSNSNPELTPDHVMIALTSQTDTVVPALLAKLGIAAAIASLVFVVHFFGSTMVHYLLSLKIEGVRPNNVMA